MAHRSAKVVIIGAGPAGCTAAVYAARAGLKPILLKGDQPGGQLTVTTDVENYPGFRSAVQGPWLMEEMIEQAQAVGAELLDETAISVDLSLRPFRISCASGFAVQSDTLIIATGARARWLGIPSETEFRGFGVSACATCDGFFYRDQNVLVVGGGNTAVEEALFLTRHAAKVTVVHRRDAFRAEKILQDRLFANPKVGVIWNNVVEEITGDRSPRMSVTGARLRDLRSGEVRAVVADGVFVAIGHDPASSLFKTQLEIDRNGYIAIAPWSTATSVAGVFSAGDVSDPRFRQAVTAAGMGCMAALEAEKFLAEHVADSVARAREAAEPEMIGAWD